MRAAFAHEAVLVMDAASDIGAPGAAVTVALCGHWEHEPPCPLAPHHTRAEPVGDEVHVRVLFAAEPDREGDVRALIDGALAGGHVPGTDTGWQLRTSGPSAVEPDEADHATRLAAT